MRLTPTLAGALQPQDWESCHRSESRSLECGRETLRGGGGGGEGEGWRKRQILTLRSCHNFELKWARGYNSPGHLLLWGFGWCSCSYLTVFLHYFWAGSSSAMQMPNDLAYVKGQVMLS